LYDRNLEEFVKTYERKFFVNSTFPKETSDRKSLQTFFRKEVLIDIETWKELRMKTLTNLKRQFSVDTTRFFQTQKKNSKSESS